MNPYGIEIRQAYGEIAEKYHQRRLSKEELNIQWLETLKGHLPAAGKVSDLGCGAGVPITRYFANRGYDVVGYDISEEMLEIARREVPNVEFHRSSIEELRLESHSLDLIISFFAIIHIERTLHEAIFARMHEWLRPGGAAFLSLGAVDESEVRDANWHGAPMVWSHFDAEANIELLRKTGFEIVWQEVEDFGGEKHLFVIAHSSSGSQLSSDHD